MRSRLYFYIQLIIVCILLFLLVLSDFGLIFVTENITARLFVHISLLLDLAVTLVLLHNHKDK